MPPKLSPAPLSDVAAVYDRRSESLEIAPEPSDRSAVSLALQLLIGLPARLLLALLWIYQRVLSPVLPVVTAGACGCRFSPTCSHYAADAIRVHGALVGTFLALRRLLKCTPLHPGGIDPVPPRCAPRCTRFSTSDSDLSALSSQL